LGLSTRRIRRCVLGNCYGGGNAVDRCKQEPGEITSRNRYLDAPLKGYEEIEQGEYAEISVSDMGMGMSKQDIENIFEPFYTKKQMGRSGTGLGMSVVWGTVKDHRGYIDINSIEGKGTTFTLFSPATREALKPDSNSVPIDEYKGSGESILVIDDVEEQREIASTILTKLDYAVASVSSGEEAIEYMKNNSPDLLIIDMIMDPGIDGLDTYKKIIEFHPNQKAIIASGFFRTDRIGQLQKMGAGQYIKKPYTLAKIGSAVKEELGRIRSAPRFVNLLRT
jgi:CheY-like chemotaxis protein